jgi:ferritin
MISKAVEKAFNEQFKKELFSSYLYLAMSAHFAENNLAGFAHWLRGQSKEELEHAMKFFDYILERGGSVELQAVDQPPSNWKSYLDAFTQVLEHEQMVTASINNLFEIAGQEKDYAAQIFLQWFITEQVEEEKNATDIVANLKLIDAHGTAVLMLDRQLGKRA